MINSAFWRPDWSRCLGAWFGINFAGKIFEAPVLLKTKHFTGTAQRGDFFLFYFVLTEVVLSRCFLKYGLWHIWWYFPNYVPWDISLARCSETWEHCGQISLLSICARFGRIPLHVSSLKALRSLGVKEYLEKVFFGMIVWSFRQAPFSRTWAGLKLAARFGPICCCGWLAWRWGDPLPRQGL